MQNLFTKFFERKQSNENILQVLAKKKKKQNTTVDCASPNIFYGGYKGSNSPSPRRSLSKNSRGGTPNSTAKGSQRRVERVAAVGQLGKNFLMPLAPNHLKVRQSPSPTSTTKTTVQKVYRTYEMGSPKASSPRERSSDTTGVLALTKKILTQQGVIDSRLLKRPGSASRETSERRLTSNAETSPKRKSDLDKFLLERKKINREFILAAKKNNPEVCLRLLAQESGRISADINCRDKDGWTALHHAAYNGNTKFVNILLYNDARVDVPDVNGVTPLILSVVKSSAPICQVLTL